jgi:hypothetical protein
MEPQVVWLLDGWSDYTLLQATEAVGMLIEIREQLHGGLDPKSRELLHVIRGGGA